MRVTLEGLRRRIEPPAAAAAPPPARVLAVFEPRSNTMKLGTMKAQLPWALVPADRSYCLQGDYGWSAREALAPLGAAAVVADSVDALVELVVRDAQPGDHVVCMSNGSFGGVHDKLLAALAARSGGGG
jgi:UDP-N-acetylmuramate: L-alanyl-gamma-D-glutamyl-meso-diaminopimelate ligase